MMFITNLKKVGYYVAITLISIANYGRYTQIKNSIQLVF
jgi:hypothetical protein